MLPQYPQRIVVAVGSSGTTSDAWQSGQRVVAIAPDRRRSTPATQARGAIAALEKRALPHRPTPSAYPMASPANGWLR